MLGSIDHVAVVVKDLETCVARYEGLGYTVTTRTELDGPVQVAMMHPAGGAGAGFEFMSPQGEDAGPLADFLAAHGEGTHHIAFRVDDVPATLEALAASGISPQDEGTRPAVGGGRIAFVGHHHGILVQLVDRPAHYLADL